MSQSKLKRAAALDQVVNASGTVIGFVVRDTRPSHSPYSVRALTDYRILARDFAVSLNALIGAGKALRHYFNGRKFTGE